MMACRVLDQADRDRKLHAEIPLPMYVGSIGSKRVLAVPREGVLRIGAVLLMVAVLAACEQTAPTKSAYSSEEPIGKTAPASGTAGPDQSRVMEELSARSRIPVTELRVLLDDCSRTQLAMTLCASRNLVAAELELDAEREAKRASVVPECRAEMDRAHVGWKAERDRLCSEETEEDKGGSMYPMLLSSCKTAATRARILFVKEAGACPGER